MENNTIPTRLHHTELGATLIGWSNRRQRRAAARLWVAILTGDRRVANAEYARLDFLRADARGRIDNNQPQLVIVG